MFIKDWKKELLTIPNLLSLFRLMLIPVYVIIYLNAKSDADYYLSAAILAVSCLTDLIDGMIARKFNMQSTIGKVLDPFADKATQLTLIVCLTVRYPILLSLIAIFAVKEGFQLIAGLLAFRRGEMLKGALLTGKICTTVLFISLITLVMLPNIGATAVTVITVIDCVFMLISFMNYIRIYYTHDSMLNAINKNPNQDEKRR